MVRLTFINSPLMKLSRLISVVLLLFISMQVKSQLIDSVSVDVYISPSNECTRTAFFTTYSSTNIVDWFWDFGDGNTGTGNNPNHGYENNGTYYVSLVATNSNAQQDTFYTNVKISGITIMNNIVVSDSILSCDSVCDAFVWINPTSPFGLRYDWSDGLSQTNNSRSNLCSGVYSVSTIETTGNSCESKVDINIGCCFSVEANTKPSSCGVCDGRIIAEPLGGVYPHKYIWSNGDTSKLIENLCPGLYSVTVIDGYSCQKIIDSIVFGGVSNCFDTIQGQVFIDDNGNCIMDGSEQVIPNLRIELNPGGAAYTDVMGNYSFIVSTGNYDVSTSLPYVFQSIDCPASGQYNIQFNSLGQKSDTNDFAIKLISYQDFSSSIYCGIARPGFTQNISFTISNDGSVKSDGLVAFTLDNFAEFISSTNNTPSPDSIDVNSNTIFWSFDSLSFLETQTFTFIVSLDPPPFLQIGDTLFNSLTIISPSGDTVVTNNISDCTNIVTGAYDPNDKAVTPSGEGPEGNITQKDTMMYYRIRFQNTGNDTAFTVIIRDTLDANLDWSSFKKGTSSHSYTVHFEEDDILVFTFNNILLPDSNVNEPASHGHVTFYMEHNGILPLGAEIENRAAIYFDFNPPIITNTVVNKIYKPVGVEELSSLNVNLYPNPTENQIIVDAGQENIKRLTVNDISGKQLVDVQSINTQKHQLNLGLDAGIYLVQVYTAKGVVTKKMVVR